VIAEENSSDCESVGEESGDGTGPEPGRGSSADGARRSGAAVERRCGATRRCSTVGIGLNDAGSEWRPFSDAEVVRVSRGLMMAEPPDERGAGAAIMLPERPKPAAEREDDGEDGEDETEEKDEEEELGLGLGLGS
jgi:hypothetical protein